MAKCIYTPNDRLFVIGGSKDSKGKETLDSITEYIEKGGFKQGETVNRSPMIDSRASFGCTINVKT